MRFADEMHLMLDRMEQGEAPVLIEARLRETVKRHALQNYCPVCYVHPGEMCLSSITLEDRGIVHEERRHVQ